MNHPTPEQWTQYVYGDLAAQPAAELEQHLNECPQCDAHVKTLRSTMRQLDSWKLPPKRRTRPSVLPLLKWATAACLVLFVGFTAGRLTAQPDTQAIRAALLPELRAELKHEVTEMIRAEVANASAQTLTKAANTADKVAATYANYVYASLKKDVDTVALHADAGLRNTTLKLNQLADYQPVSSQQ
jgi:anti-sigma factor RsiW